MAFKTTAVLSSRNDRKRISMRTIRALARQIAKRFQPERIIMFGSYAYGRPQSGSDVDILIVMETPLRNREQAAQITRALDYRFGLDVIVRSPSEIDRRLKLGDFFIEEVTTKGQVLYARPDSRMGRKS